MVSEHPSLKRETVEAFASLNQMTEPEGPTMAALDVYIGLVDP